MAKVTIGIPVYNEIRFIENTLRSVVGQADEIIISDNASTDGTSDICRQFAEKYPEIRYFRHDVNCGAIKNFLYCLNMASCEYFMWMGGHDIIFPGHVNKLACYLDKHEDTVLVYTDTLCMSAEYAYITTIQDCYCKYNSENASERVINFSSMLENPNVFYGLHRTRYIRDAANFKCHIGKDGFSDMLMITYLARLGKIVLLPSHTYVSVMPRQCETTLHEASYRMIRSLKNLSNDALINPFEYPLRRMLGEYLVALDMEKSGEADKGFSDLMLVVIVKRYWRTYGLSIPRSFLSTDLIEYDKHYEDSLLKIISALKKGENQSRCSAYLKSFKKALKFVLPYGALLLLQKNYERKN